MDKKMQIRQEIISPQEAMKIIESKNKSNRNVSERYVCKYLKDMQSGKWIENNPNATISFDTSGNLIDGQHRLIALSRHDKPLSFYVATDVPEEMFEYMDCGRARCAHDFVNPPNQVSKASIALRMCSIDAGVRPDRRSPSYNSPDVMVTRSMVIDRANNDDLVYEILKISQSVSRALSSSINKTTVAAWLYSEYIIGNFSDAILASEAISGGNTLAAVSFCNFHLKAKMEKNYSDAWKIGSLRMFLMHTRNIQDDRKLALNKSEIHFAKLAKELKSIINF